MTKPFVDITIPLRLVSEANRATTLHWRHRHRRAKEQREIVGMVLGAKLRALGLKSQSLIPCIVTMTRIGPRQFDVDNSVSAFKHPQDSIAQILGVDDRENDKVQWRYEQRKGMPKEYALRIVIEPWTKPKYPWLVVIVREGVSEATGFTDEKAAYDYYDRAGTQWSDSYLCRVERGPVV